MVKFLGVQKVQADIVDKQTGEQVHIDGFNLWFSEPNTYIGCIGYKPFKKFMNPTSYENLVSSLGGVKVLESYVNKDCTVIFNQYGKIQDILFK